MANQVKPPPPRAASAVIASKTPEEDFLEGATSELFAAEVAADTAEVLFASLLIPRKKEQFERRMLLREKENAPILEITSGLDAASYESSREGQLGPKSKNGTAATSSEETH